MEGDMLGLKRTEQIEYKEKTLDARVIINTIIYIQKIEEYKK